MKLKKYIIKQNKTATSPRNDDQENSPSLSTSTPPSPVSVTSEVQVQHNSSNLTFKLCNLKKMYFLIIFRFQF